MKYEQAIRMSMGDNPLKPIKILSMNLVSNSVWNVRLLDAYGNQFVKKVDAKLVEACEKRIRKNVK